MKWRKEILIELSKIGRENKQTTPVPDILQFNDLYDRSGELKSEELNEEEKNKISKFLILNAILDQGPDIVGVRRLLKESINDLYRRDIDLLANPSDFFEHIGIVSEIIEKNHKEIKNDRAEDWAEEQGTAPEKYSLYFSQSQRGMRSNKRIGWYLMGRWGTPFFNFVLLKKDEKNVIDFIEGFESSEKMSRKLKKHDRYGLGKAIGNKACHLFAKWYIYSYDLVTDRHLNPTINGVEKDKGWNGYSYEMPFDSNIGRVLFRTGWFYEWTDEDSLIADNAIQEGRGKSGAHYLRVTNVRRNSDAEKGIDDELKSNYGEIVTQHLKTKTKRWRNLYISKIPNALLLDTEYEIGELDDGLMYIGTNYCTNTGDPDCQECPINDYCKGFRENNDLIENYRT